MYKNKQFEEAIRKYEEASEVYPKDITYLTNLAAVLIETKEYQKCLETCDKAIQEGRSN